MGRSNTGDTAWPPARRRAKSSVARPSAPLRRSQDSEPVGVSPGIDLHVRLVNRRGLAHLVSRGRGWVQNRGRGEARSDFVVDVLIPVVRT